MSRSGVNYRICSSENLFQRKIFERTCYSFPVQTLSSGSFCVEYVSGCIQFGESKYTDKVPIFKRQYSRVAKIRSIIYKKLQTFEICVMN